MRTRSGNSNVAGITPTIVYGSPFTLMVFPIAAESPEYMSRQSGKLSTAVAGAPDSLSLGRKVRPSIGRTPSTSKMVEVTRDAPTRSGRSPALTVAVPRVKPPKISKDVCRAAYRSKSPSATPASTMCRLTSVWEMYAMRDGSRNGSPMMSVP
jgi:hypothetical protein